MDDSVPGMRGVAEVTRGHPPPEGQQRKKVGTKDQTSKKDREAKV